jgi:plastocyanin
MKTKNLYLSILVLLISAIAMNACSKGSSYNSMPPVTPPAANSVSIVNMSFSPASLTVVAGTTVTWTNNDNMTHTVTSDATGFDSGNLTVGSKFSQMFSTAGTYAYHCTIHPTMKGTIIVK